MNNYLPELDPQGDVKPTFNTSDWKWITGYVTYADLLKYADKYVSNVFFPTQYFTSLIFNVSINDVSVTAFSFLKNVTSDIQDQLNTLLQRTTNMSYSSTTNRTTFTSTLAAPIMLLNNVNLNTRITGIETNVSTLQTKTTAQSYSGTTTTTTFTGTLATPVIKLNGTDLHTRLTTDETNITTLQTQMTSANTDISSLKTRQTTTEGNVTTLQTQMTTANTNITNLQTQQTQLSNTVATKANDNSVVHLTGNESISGVKTFLTTPTINAVNIATTTDISTAIGNLINSAPSTLDTLGEIATQLQNNQNSVNTILSSMVTLTGVQTISGQKTFSGTTYFNSISTAVLSIFQGIQTTTLQFTQSINGISPAIFNYLSNVTSDIQTQFISIYTRLTNYQYDGITSTQLINSSTAILDNTTTNQLMVNTITSNTLHSNAIHVNQLTCSNLKCTNLVDSFPIPVVYIINQNIPFPILKSGQISNLTGLNIASPIYITIAPKYQIIFVDANGVALAQIRNPTTNFIYNAGLSFTSNVPSEFRISVIT